MNENVSLDYLADIKFRCFRHYELKPSGLSLSVNLAEC